jgi:hypothetical protein
VQSKWYEIRIQGTLPLDWVEWSDGMEIREEGEGLTVLAGWVADQAALRRMSRPSRSRSTGAPQADRGTLQSRRLSLSRAETHVDDHRHGDDQTDEGVLNVGIRAKEHEPRADFGHDEGADEGADDAAHPA